MVYSLLYGNSSVLSGGGLSPLETFNFGTTLLTGQGEGFEQVSVSFPTAVEDNQDSSYFFALRAEPSSALVSGTRDLIGYPTWTQGSLTSQDSQDNNRYVKRYRLSGTLPANTPDSERRMQITLRSPDFDAAINLYNASGTLLQFSTADVATGLNGTDERITGSVVFLPLGDFEYLIDVTSEDPLETGGFVLSVSNNAALTPTGGGFLDTGALFYQQQSLSSSDRFDPYYYPAGEYYADDWALDIPYNAPSTTVTVHLFSSAFDTYLTIFNAETGQVRVLYENDDHGGSIDDSQITFDGIRGMRYWVRVSSYDERETGAYAIRASFE